jgi:ethanolamine permease
VHPRFRTPHIATLAGGVVGIAAIYSDNLVTIAGQSLTASIVTMAVFGALVMYGMSMASLFRLRRAEPALARPYRAPLYPAAPAFALLMAAICFVALVIYNPAIFAIFLAVMVLAVLASKWLATPGAVVGKPAYDPVL